jgi:hypothetical protein
METTIEKHFAKLGARTKIAVPRDPLRGRFGIDIAEDARGEYFAIEVPHFMNVELLPLEVRPDLRHLVLLARREQVDGRWEKDKYLCGHDERHWFVAGVDGSVTNVKTAMESLRPGDVSHHVERHVRAKNRLRRKNEAFVRQGEWFFLPQPDVVAPESLILRHEPLSRGDGGKPHWCEEAYRHGGEAVYVCNRHPRGVTTEYYLKLLEKNSDAKNWNWTMMRRNARVYARGRISHPDHKTIELPFWHLVLMNDEHRRGVVFLD